jgi:LysR family transcriptional regulator, hydrogen peroxide-inducible genes activator
MHGMTLSDLQYLVVVAEERSFRRAAERCHITQPTLSGQVKKIEGMLGVSLFERGTKGLAITDVGQEIIKEARIILTHADHITDLARSYQGFLVGSFRLGIIPTLCPYFLPCFVRPLQRAFVRLSLTICEDLTDNLVIALRSFSLDALMLALPVAGNDLVSLPLFEERFLFVSHPDHPLAALDEVSEDDLDDTNLILLNEGHCLREQALAVCGRRVSHGTLLTSDLRAASLETARQMVAAGLGCTLMPALSVTATQHLAMDVAVRPFSARDARRCIGLVWRRSSSRQADMQHLASFIRQHLPANVTAVEEPVNSRECC